MAPRIPLKERPLDLVYFSFFLMHIPASLLCDLQALFYPYTWLPFIPEWYIEFSKDPLISGAMRKDKDLVWFLTFLTVELLFQLPTFILGARALWNDQKSIYILLVAYGASTATTTLPCITHVINDTSLTSQQLRILLGSYIPFFLLPLGMAVDMALRVARIVDASSADKTEKSQ